VTYSSPLKIDCSVIKSNSQPPHNAETDIKTDTNLMVRTCPNQFRLEHGYANTGAHLT